MKSVTSGYSRTRTKTQTSEYLLFHCHLQDLLHEHAVDIRGEHFSLGVIFLIFGWTYFTAPLLQLTVPTVKYSCTVKELRIFSRLWNTFAVTVVADIVG